VDKEEMPPHSAEVLAGDFKLTDEERRRIGEWLLGGAPGVTLP
jgi:hypothetical protein